MPGQLVHPASFHFNEHSQLALNDCFALTLAEEIGDCILLTGDGPLRRIAENNDIEVRGVLWVTDELEVHEVESPAALHAARRSFQDDDLVFLPPDEVSRRISRLVRLL